MKNLLVIISFMCILAACTHASTASKSKKIVITKAFVEENAEVGLTQNEVRERFGPEALADNVEHLETWLYDSAQNSEFEYNRSLESVAHKEIKEGKLKYQFYINFKDEKAIMYSYFYLGEDGKVWGYEITPDMAPQDSAVSD